MTRLDATAFLDSLGCSHVLYFHDDSKITKETEFGFIKKGVEKQEHCFYTTQNPEDVLNKMKEFGIEDPPNAGGGCLLTDPAFSLRAKDLFKHIETPTTNDIDLLKIGRHFRLDENVKLIVGRNKDENEMIKVLALPNDILLEDKENVGPTVLLRGDNTGKHVEFSASVTLRYSDAPKNKTGIVLIHKNEDGREISIKPAEETSYIKLRI